MAAADDALARLAFEQTEDLLATAPRQTALLPEIEKRVKSEQEVAARLFTVRLTRPRQTVMAGWASGPQLFGAGSMIPLDPHSRPRGWARWLS